MLQAKSHLSFRPFAISQACLKKMSNEADGETKEALASSTYRSSAERAPWRFLSAELDRWEPTFFLKSLKGTTWNYWNC